MEHIRKLLRQEKRCHYDLKSLLHQERLKNYIWYVKLAFHVTHHALYILYYLL